MRYLRHALTVTGKDFRRLFRDRGGMALLVAVPIALITIVGLSFSSLSRPAAGAPAAASVGKIAMVDADRGPQALRFAALLRGQGVEVVPVAGVAAARAGVEHGRYPLAVVVPAGFSAGLAAGRSAAVTLVQGHGPAAEGAGGGRLLGAVYLNAGYLNAVVLSGRAASAELAHALPPDEARTSAARVEDGVFRALASATAPLPVAVGIQASSSTVGPVNFFNQVVPGYAVMFALFSIAAGAATLIEERESGTFRRLVVSPMARGSLLSGKLVFQFALTLMQVLVLLTVGALAFGMTLRLWPMLLARVLALSFATTSFGLLLVSLVKSRRQLSGISTVVVLGFSAVGGSWWPLWLEPDWVKNAAKLSITYWAMSGFNGIMVFGRSAADVAPAVVALLLYGSVCYAAGLVLFQRQTVTA
jgi:ABC-2 type transport system permease protein